MITGHSVPYPCPTPYLRDDLEAQERLPVLLSQLEGRFLASLGGLKRKDEQRGVHLETDLVVLHALDAISLRKYPRPVRANLCTHTMMLARGRESGKGKFAAKWLGVYGHRLEGRPCLSVVKSPGARDYDYALGLQRGERLA